MSEKKKLLEEYYFEIVKHEEFYKVFQEKRKLVFKEEHTVWLDKFYNDNEKNFKIPKSDVYVLRILVYYKEEIVGWFLGFQKTNDFYMMNTGILKEHQGKGIYSKLLKEIIEIIRPEGFLYITSSHLASNNQVLIPKLKAGFHITGMEINDVFGIFVNLKYIFNKKIKDVYFMRTGKMKPTKEML